MKLDYAFDVILTEISVVFFQIESSQSGRIITDFEELSFAESGFDVWEMKKQEMWDRHRWEDHKKTIKIR